MIIVGQALVSEDILEKKFECQILSCKGACCVQGDAGAPLDAAELEVIAAEYENVRPFMAVAGLAKVEEVGFHEKDRDGDLVTTCLPGGECVFVVYDEAGIAGCAIEKAYFAGKTWFRKPLSCHLYPIRAKQYGEYMALNYHSWNLCSEACRVGEEKKVPVYRFLKEALTRKMGPSWYEEFEAVAEVWESQKPR
jgi:hypothetical protein